MKAFTITPAIEPPSAPASNRRQPLRQTRTNPLRNATNVNQPQGPQVDTQDTTHQPTPGFFPAITHFTDSIAALPREMSRNYTMLKEVDAKTYGPEEALGRLVAEVRKAPVPSRKGAHSTHGHQAVGTVPARRETTRSEADHQGSADPTDLRRRHLFRDLRLILNEMLGTLDEKNHVMSTANDFLDKQLARCESSFRHLGNEISDEARFGSSNHWAYIAKVPPKKGTLAVERNRRDAAANNPSAGAGLEHDGVVSRSELRREALAARKNRNHQLDHEFDDGRSTAHTANRKAQTNGKGRKAAEAASAANGTGVGLGIAHAPSPIGPPSKRRKVEKQGPDATPVGLPIERAMGTVYGSNGAGAKRASGSPRDTPTAETAKKKGRTTGPANGAAKGRTNTNVTMLNSPSKASSPIAGTFIVAKDAHRKSPIPLITQRAQPSRARQNSAQSLVQDNRTRPSSSTSNKLTNGNTAHGNSTDMEKIAGSASKSIMNIKTTSKEGTNSKSDRPFEDISTGDGPSDVPGGGLGGGKALDPPPKDEEIENGSYKARVDRPPSISVSTRGSGKHSKTTTPLNASFPEPSSRSRPNRAVEPPIKRSHKKGAGLAAQLAAAAAAARQDDEGSSMQGDDDDDDDVDGMEPRYCYCNQVSYGEMVACDMDSCPREWFHLDCVGLAKAPPKTVKWYCNECKERLKKEKSPSSATPGNG